MVKGFCVFLYFLFFVCFVLFFFVFHFFDPPKVEARDKLRINYYHKKKFDFDLEKLAPISNSAKSI